MGSGLWLERRLALTGLPRDQESYMARRRIIIVGGGFGGASAAVQLARKIAEPLAITIVEPSHQIGPGLAYSTDDPTFRLNAISGPHSIDVADPGHFTRWCAAKGLAQSDPEARIANGELFVRRRDFRDYLVETVRAHLSQENGSTITHVRDRASDISVDEQGVAVSLEGGRRIAADMAFLAVGNPPLRQPAWASGAAAGHPGLFAEPLRTSFDSVERDAKVLVVGAGLTALDIVASLLARGHRGSITAISRRGLRPEPQAPRVLAPPADPPQPPVIPLDLLEGELPAYATGEPLSALDLFRGMRRHAAETDATELGWQAAFDAVTLPLSRIWPNLPLPEKQRALRHLRAYYDAHRFRTPPMTDAMVRAREATGQVIFRKASIERLDVDDQRRLVAWLQTPDTGHTREAFDAVINCTGFDNGRALQGNSLLARLQRRGMIAPHPTGLGIEVDMQNRIITASGESIAQIRAIGPMTAGVFGDPLGVFFISAQVHRLIPGLAEQFGLTLTSRNC